MLTPPPTKSVVTYLHKVFCQKQIHMKQAWPKSSWCLRRPAKCCPPPKKRQPLLLPLSTVLAQHSPTLPISSSSLSLSSFSKAGSGRRKRSRGGKWAEMSALTNLLPEVAAPVHLMMDGPALICRPILKRMKQKKGTTWLHAAVILSWNSGDGCEQMFLSLRVWMYIMASRQKHSLTLKHPVVHFKPHLELLIISWMIHK